MEAFEELRLRAEADQQEMLRGFFFYLCGFGFKLLELQVLCFVFVFFCSER